jgi:hypothetical protein
MVRRGYLIALLLTGLFGWTGSQAHGQALKPGQLAADLSGPHRRTLDQQPSSQHGRSPGPSGVAGILDVRLKQLSTRNPAVAGLAHAVCAARVNYHWREHAGVLLGEVVHQGRGRRRKVWHSLPRGAG